MLPANILIDPTTGSVSPATGRYEKRLSEVRGIYRDQVAVDQLLAAAGDVLTYEVLEYKAEGADLFFGTTTMYPGRVGDEYFMTRGHYHQRSDRGETYYTQSGQGVLLLERRDGRTQTLDMKPGICSFIPPGWAHRSVNTGEKPLVFVWTCNQDAGNGYGDILARGMRQLVVQRAGAAVCIANPNSAA